MTGRENWLLDAGMALDLRRLTLLDDIMKQADQERDRLVLELAQAVKDRATAQEQALSDSYAREHLIARCNELYGQLCRERKRAVQDDPKVCQILLDAERRKKVASE